MVAATGAMMLTVAGCGGGDQSASPAGDAPSAKMAKPTAAPSKPPSFMQMRFSSSNFACRPKAGAQVKGSWETKAPRFRVKPGAKVKLGLSNSGGAKTPVLAVVNTQRGGHAFAKATQKDSWSNVEFPKDFVTAKAHRKVKSYPKGVYTVVWLTAQGHQFISCDGFATVGAKDTKPKTAHKPQHSSKPTPAASKTS